MSKNHNDNNQQHKQQQQQQQQQQPYHHHHHHHHQHKHSDQDHNNRQLVTTIFVPNNGQSTYSGSTIERRPSSTLITLSTPSASSNDIASQTSGDDNGLNLLKKPSTNHHVLSNNISVTLPRRSNSSLSSTESAPSLPSSSNSFESLAYPRNNRSTTNDNNSDINNSTNKTNLHGIPKIKKGSSSNTNSKATFIVASKRRLSDSNRSTTNWHTTTTTNNQRLFSPTIPIGSAFVKQQHNNNLNLNFKNNFTTINNKQHIRNVQPQVGGQVSMEDDDDDEEEEEEENDDSYMASHHNNQFKHFNKHNRSHQSYLRNQQQQQHRQVTLDNNDDDDMELEANQFMQVNTNIVQEPFSRKQLLLNQQFHMNMASLQNGQTNRHNALTITTNKSQKMNGLLVAAAGHDHAPVELPISDVSEYASVLIRDLHYEVGRGRHKKTILDSINLTVPEGSIYGLLGPSGCGKTTMLRCTVGRLKPQRGSLLVFGYKPNDSECQIPGRAVGYMPQEISIYEDFTIEETLKYFGKINRMKNSQIKQRIEFLLSFLDLPTKKRLVANLSGGQKRRVSLAAALVHSPPLLILDEPTVGVDPLLRQSIWEHLVTLTQTEKISVIITTHYIEEARQANVVGLMRHGKILAENSPQQLMFTYGLNSLEDVFLKLCVTDSSRRAATLATSSGASGAGQLNNDNNNPLYTIEATLESNALKTIVHNGGAVHRNQSSSTGCSTIKRSISSGDAQLINSSSSSRSRSTKASGGQRQIRTKQSHHRDATNTTARISGVNKHLPTTNTYQQRKLSHKRDLTVLSDDNTNKHQLAAYTNDALVLMDDDHDSSNDNLFDEPSGGSNGHVSTSMALHKQRNNSSNNNNNRHMTDADYLITNQYSTESQLVKWASRRADPTFKRSKQQQKIHNTLKENGSRADGTFTQWCKTLMAVTWKNFVRLKRNPPVLIFQFIVPAIQVILFCSCIGGEPFDVPVAIVNEEVIPQSSQLFLNGLDKKIVRQVKYNNLSVAIEAVRRGKAWGVIHIPDRYSQNLQSRLILGDEVTNETISNGTIRVYPDLTNLHLALALETTLRETFISFARDSLENLGYDRSLADLPIQVAKPIYGTMKKDGYLEFMAPGVVISISYVMATGLTALAFILERRDGLLERSLVSGVQTSQILLAHAINQVVVMTIQIVLVLACTFFVFEIPSRGPFVWVVLLILLQGCTGMAFGLLVSAVCEEENTAVMMLVGTFYTNLILAGIIWPIEAMPHWLRPLSYAQPQTLPTETLRHILSRGWGITEPGVYAGFAVTIGWLVAFLLAAGMIFKYSK